MRHWCNNAQQTTVRITFWSPESFGANGSSESASWGDLFKRRQFLAPPCFCLPWPQLMDSLWSTVCQLLHQTNYKNALKVVLNICCQVQTLQLCVKGTRTSVRTLEHGNSSGRQKRLDNSKAKVRKTASRDFECAGKTANKINKTPGCQDALPGWLDVGIA